MLALPTRCERQVVATVVEGGACEATVKGEEGEGEEVTPCKFGHTEGRRRISRACIVCDQRNKAAWDKKMMPSRIKAKTRDGAKRRGNR